MSDFVPDLPRLGPLDEPVRVEVPLAGLFAEAERREVARLARVTPPLFEVEQVAS